MGEPGAWGRDGGLAGSVILRVLWVATPAVPDLASLHGSPAVFVQQKGQSTGTAKQVHLVKGGAVRAQVSRPRLLVAFTSTTPAPTYLCLTALLLPAPCSYPCTVRGPRPTPAPVPPALLSCIPPACCPCPLLSPRAEGLLKHRQSGHRDRGGAESEGCEHIVTSHLDHSVPRVHQALGRHGATG